MAREMRILIVEDETIVALDLKNMLSSMGYEVTSTASTGKEAIERARVDRPDLILMDIILRGPMDGVEAAGAIREMDDIPIIYLTAHSDQSMVQRMKVTEPYGYILKPFEDPEVCIIAEMAIKKHRMERNLKEREQYLAVILKSIDEGVIVTDAEGMVKMANPVAEAMLGCRQDQAVGMDIKEMLSSGRAQILPFSERPPDAFAGEGGPALYKIKGKESRETS